MGDNIRQIMSATGWRVVSVSYDAGECEVREEPVVCFALLDQVPVAWHLAGCAKPARPESHCEVGRLLMATDGNPDGHCQSDGVCPRCRTERELTSSRSPAAGQHRDTPAG